MILLKLTSNSFEGFAIERLSITFPSKKSLKVAIFHLDMLQVGSQIYIYIYIWKLNFSFLFSYIVYSQIWLNHLMDDHHLEQLHLKIENKKEKEKEKEKKNDPYSYPGTHYPT
jgi:hypothetical protein